MSDLSTHRPLRAGSGLTALQGSYELNDSMADSALQELVDILSRPFAQSCMQCQGWGIGPGHHTCPVCNGRGSVLKAR